MQEEVTQKTIALVIKTAKLDANVLKAAMRMYLNHRRQKHRTQHLPQPLLLPQQIHGPVPVERQVTPVSSVQSADHQSLLQQMDGYVPAAQSTRANSVRNAEPRSRQENRFISVTSADGSRKIRKIHRSSVRSVVTHLMMEISKTLMIMTCNKTVGFVVEAEVEHE